MSEDEDEALAEQPNGSERTYVELSDDDEKADEAMQPGEQSLAPSVVPEGVASEAAVAEAHVVDAHVVEVAAAAEPPGPGEPTEHVVVGEIVIIADGLLRAIYRFPPYLEHCLHQF